MLWKDLAYAARVLRNNPVFAIPAVVTLALGVGATTAIFGVTHAVLLWPLPYKDPDRLVLACGDMRKRDVKDFPFSNAEFFDLRDQAKSSFGEFGAVRTGRNILPREDGAPEQIRFAQVTTNFFRMMGARIQFGRDFVESDGQPPPPPPQVPAPNAQPQQPPTAMAILSYEYFERRYGGNTAILGHRMLNGGTGGAQVVGGSRRIFRSSTAAIHDSEDRGFSCPSGADAAASGERGPSCHSRADGSGDLSFADRVRERRQSHARARVPA